MPSRFLHRALAGLRWALLALLLVLAWREPTTGLLELPVSALLALFAAYNLLTDLLLARVPTPRALTLRSLLDLPAVGLVYFLGQQAGGPLFTLFFLAVVCAGAILPLRASLLYTAGAAALAAVLEPGGLTTALAPGDPHALGARLAVLIFVGGGAAILKRGLILEQDAARALRDEAARLAELDRLRADFIATISHDLQTPFTAMRAGLGLVETSLQDRLRPEERQVLGHVRRNNDRLGILINDLLTFNEVEAGALQLERTPLDLRACVGNAIAVVHPLIMEKEQTLEVDLPAPLLYDGDARRLEQVLVNLLDNARRHTPSGTRILVVGRATADEVRLVVRDTGPGIPPAEQEAIFARFHRSGSTARGSGLGLAIARALVELHGGRIWVESTPGAGAAFHLAFPRQAKGDPR